jgi:hypothetical protein
MHWCMQDDQIGLKIVALAFADMARLPLSITTKIPILSLGIHLSWTCLAQQSSIFDYEDILLLALRFSWGRYSSQHTFHSKHDEKSEQKFRSKTPRSARTIKVMKTSFESLTQLFCRLGYECVSQTHVKRLYTYILHTSAHWARQHNFNSTLQLRNNRKNTAENATWKEYNRGIGRLIKSEEQRRFHKFCQRKPVSLQKYEFRTIVNIIFDHFSPISGLAHS